MSDEKNINTTNENTSKKDNIKKKKLNIRMLLVLVVLILFGIYTGISLRAQYLNTIEINPKYVTVFWEKIRNHYSILISSIVAIYIFVYIINKFIKKGLKKFFDEEKKQMPKLPNKSLCLIMSVIGGGIAANTLSSKFSMFINGGQFGQTDPIFKLDIGYYMFSLPFIQSLLILLMEIIIVTIIYVALYYVITLNHFFDGVNIETLKKNTFLKQEMAFIVIIAILFCCYIFISSQNILTGTMIEIGDEAKTKLVGAGNADVTIKLWGYRLLSVVILIAVVRLLRCIKKQNFKQGVISVLLVPGYLVLMFVVMVGFEFVYVDNNELDAEKEYIEYNIKNTKKAYGIDIDQKNISEYETISSEQIADNQDVIDNIPTISKNVTQTAIKEHQENSVYYSYDNTALSLYNIGTNKKLVYMTPREISNDNTISYNNRTLKYTHGYSAIISSASDSDGDGYAEYILSDFNSEDILNIKEPRIYFGLNTDSTIMVNTSYGNEYDYPLTETTYQENNYDGKAGLNVGFLDRFILGISENNLKLAFSTLANEDTKIMPNRNILERAKTILPSVIYDEEPYLVITDSGRLVWVLDGYTRSCYYPYSQITTINIKGYRERINYIRNSVKILIDAYDGTTEYYITDKTDPIIMTYRNMYPDLFIEDELPKDIQKHLVYPKFLYQIQAEMLNIYHNISEDTLYRADDIWQITTKASSTNSTIAGASMEPYYAMLKTIDSNKSELGLLITYNKFEKQNIISYAVGTVRDGKNNLTLYKFNSESNVVGIMQLNNQIDQNTTIASELADLNTTGIKLVKDMIIIPINNSLLYVEPVYQVMLNESEVPVLKKVIVASGNTVAIGDNLQSALDNLFTDDYAVDLEFINLEDMDELIDSVIKANNNLKESMNAQDYEMIGKDFSKLQAIINQLESARKNELEEAETNKIEDENILSNVINNVVNENSVEENIVQNTVSTNNIAEE